MSFFCFKRMRFFPLALLMIACTSCQPKKSHEIFFSAVECIPDPNDDDSSLMGEPEDFDSEEFKQCFENLFETHGLLINEAIVAELNDDVPYELSTEDSLYENAHDMASLLSMVYEPAIVQRFESLFNQHIKLQFQYIEALKTCHIFAAKRIAMQADHHGDMFIEFLSLINPYFAYRIEQKVFEKYLFISHKLVCAYFRQDYCHVEELRDQTIDLLREISRHFSKAVVKQFYDSSLYGSPCCIEEDL